MAIESHHPRLARRSILLIARAEQRAHTMTMSDAVYQRDPARACTITGLASRRALTVPKCFIAQDAIVAAKDHCLKLPTCLRNPKDHPHSHDGRFTAPLLLLPLLEAARLLPLADALMGVRARAPPPLFCRTHSSASSADSSPCITHLRQKTRGSGGLSSQRRQEKSIRWSQLTTEAGEKHQVLVRI